jgi:dTDP-4-dehydrorhamnose reductase
MSEKKILITGASSYVGAGIHRDLAGKYETVGTFLNSPISERLIKLDTTNKADVRTLVSRESPSVIVHAAGAASLKWCLEHPEDAKRINEDATRNIIEAANAVGAGVIFISSFAAINPDNPYALGKSESEKMIRELAEKGVVIRPTVVLGVSPNLKNDKLMNRIIRNITEGTTPTYDNTWQIQPTDLSHLSQVISAVIDRQITQKTIPVVTDKLVTYFDIARDILTNFGLEANPSPGHPYPPEKDDLSVLKSLNLPLKTYDMMIQDSIRDIGKILNKK